MFNYKKNKRLKKYEVPIQEDIELLLSYCYEQRSKAMLILKKRFDYDASLTLSQCIF